MNKRKLSRVASTVVVAAAFLVSSYRTDANLRNPFDEFKAGDKVEATVSGLVGVENSYEPCTVTEVLGNGYRLKCSGIEYVVQKAWVRRPINAVVEKPGVANPQPIPGPVQNEEQAQCDFNPPGPKVANADRFSTDLAKRKLYDNYQLSVRPGGVDSPLKVGVAWQSAKLIQTFTNVVDAQGFRINNAAPVGSTIFRVSSKHIVCEQYRNATERRQVESNYACFKNRDGEWVCGLDGVPKILQLN